MKFQDYDFFLINDTNNRKNFTDDGRSSYDYDMDFGLEGSSIADWEKIEDICEAAVKISEVYLWVLFTIGVPGNILTIITTLTMQAMSPATFFVALLAFFDGAALVLKLIYHQLLQHKVRLGDAGCKMEFAVLYLATVANWMLVLICAERFISVCYPLKKISIITKRRSYICAAVVSAFFMVFYGALFLIMRGSYKNIFCYTTEKFENFWRNYYYWLNASMYLFLPFFLCLILTICIIRGLHISRRDRRSLLQKGSGREEASESSARNNQRMMADAARVERAITIMMILAAVLFLVFALPACVYNLMSQTSNTQCGDSVKQAYWILFGQVQHLLADATHALNFFLYFIAAKRFRDHLFKLLRCKTCKKERLSNRYQNTYSTQLSTSTKIHNSVTLQSPVK